MRPPLFGKKIKVLIFKNLTTIELFDQKNIPG